MLSTIETLFERLHRAGIRYCHWKSNWVLDATLAGETDLDLLVHREDAGRFRSILRELGFEPSLEAEVPALPAVEHHHALDLPSAEIVHVHAYYRIITGESLAKSYRFPLEEMLLADAHLVDGVRVPVPGAELIVFVLRMLIKHTSIIELMLLGRDSTAVREEAAWLLAQGAEEKAEALATTWLPAFDLDLLREGIEVLRGPSPLWRRVVLGYRTRRAIRGFARHGALRRWTVETTKFARRMAHRLAGRRKKLTPGTGGAVIAVVGADASGKSTTLDQLERWLRRHFTVRRVHAGKPPATPLTWLPHLLLPLLRAAFPGHRLTRVEARKADPAQREEPESLLFALRAVMLAYERRALLVRAYAHAANGTIVLADRYPSSQLGATDSPQLHPPGWSEGRHSWQELLSRWEHRLYRQIPPADLVIHLTAPLDVALARNAARGETDPEDYLRLRHQRSGELRFDRATVHRIDTDQPLDASLREVKQVVWSALTGAPSPDRDLGAAGR